jgi:hypothetical protein
MPDRTIDAYLEALKAALKGCDKALIQDAVWDAEDHLRSELARGRWKEPGLDEDQALQKILAAYGEPAEVAAAYKERDAVVSAALAPPRPAARPMEEDETPLPAVRPGFFGVLKDFRAYTSLLYLLISIGTGIFFFTWAVTGISLSLGLLVLIIGIPIAIAFLGSVRLLALSEGRLVEAMLGVRMPRRQPPEEGARGWKARILAMLQEGRTWSSLGYLLLMLPLGITYFTIMVTMLSLSLALLATPVVHFVFHEVTFDGWDWGLAHANTVAVVWGVLGIFAVPLTLHIARGLGRIQGRLARHMLVRI